MQLVYGSQMKKVDAMTIEKYKIPGMVLMENACLRVLDFLCRQPGFGHSRIVVIVGKGNNGGDGLALFRHLINLRTDCALVLVCNADEFAGDTKAQWQILQEMQIPQEQFFSYGQGDEIQKILKEADILVDGVFGTGLRGSMEDSMLNLCQWYNESQALRVAIDIPSGLNGSTGQGERVMKAHATVTFGLPKVGQLLDSRKQAGQIWVGNIGIPSKIWELFPSDCDTIEAGKIRQWLGTRDPAAHKGTMGKVLIIGGSPGLTGAVALASRAAVRCGAGLVTAAVPAGLNAILEAKLTEPMTYPLSGDPEVLTEEDGDTLLELSSGRDALVMGPGMGREPRSKPCLHRLLTQYTGPLVLDADGLFHLAGLDLPEQEIKCSLILTPHAGEAARLLEQTVEEVENDRIRAAKTLATRYRAVVVLKGSRTLVTDGQAVAVNTTGNPGMATGGTGDVLSGMLGALAARGLSAFQTACAAVWLHGLAGDRAALARTEEAMQAGDLIECLPEAFQLLAVARRPEGLLIPLEEEMMGETDETGMGRN